MRSKHARGGVSFQLWMRLFRFLAVALAVLCGRITDANASEVRLVDGTILYGEIVRIDDGDVVLRTTHLGELTIDGAQIVSIDGGVPEALDNTSAPPDEQNASSETKDDAKSESKESEDPTKGAAKEKTWDLRLDLGVSTATGDSDDQEFTFRLNYTDETERYRLRVDSSYYLKISDGSTTDNKFTAGFQYDWLNPKSPWYAFASGRFDFDEFESWEQRIAAHAGPGYQIIDRDALKWNVRGGLGVRKEFESTNDDLLPEAVFATAVRWNPTAKISLAYQTEYYPVITDFADYRFRSTFDARYRMTDIISLSFGALHEFQSIVDPGDSNNDLRLTLAVGFDF